jgi:DNA modification methylase
MIEVKDQTINKYYQDAHVTLYNGDCRSMAEIPDESIQCVVTSPPYWGLRKYAGMQDLVSGGDEDCQHVWGENIIRKDRGAAAGKSDTGG